jgi:glutamate synthase (NADPH/NADH) small chain
MDYLTHQNRVVAGLASLEPRFNAAGKRVIILGGGDTGSDCLGTALRQGAANVMQVSYAPPPPAVRALNNPWPRWPLVFRTSSSQEEGGQREFGLVTQRLEGQDGQLKALHSVKVELTTGTDGKPALAEIPGSETAHPVDLLVLAIGFTGPDSHTLSEELGVKLTPRGTVQVDSHFATSADGVFCAGDASRGASLIVWAFADGRETARSVDAYLSRGASALPTRGKDCAVG